MSDLMGRIDIFVLRMSHAICQRITERTGVELWNSGGERIAHELIKEVGLPTEPIDIPMTIARNVLGILPEAPLAKRRVNRRRRPSSVLTRGSAARRRA